MEALFYGSVWYLVFLLSTTFHEASHAFTAKMGGDLTAYEAGQVTLDPMPHIRREPFGMVVVPIIFFFMSGWMIGWASTPFDPVWAREHPRKAALMGLAGPMSNLFLVLLSGAIIKVGLDNGFFIREISDRMELITTASPDYSGIATLLSVIFLLNLILFTFNLLPFPPLDGSSAITLFMNKKTALAFSDKIRTPAFSIMGLFVVYILFPYIFRPVYVFAVRVLFT